MKRLIQLYRDAFSGLTRPAWMLAIVMLINRSGTMVLPFLGVYLKSSLGFTLEQTGIVLSCFGLGAMAGSFLGGWLTDKFGHFYVQVLSLILGGALFIMLSNVTQFYALAAGILVLSTIAESFRPANASSVSFYAKPENVVRAFSLNRMAINLGFSVGPALGGLLAAISFKWLFIADGSTCILAGIFFFLYFRNIQGSEPSAKKTKNEPTKSVYRDTRYIFFIILTSGFAVMFFQLFITLPLYYRDVYDLSENRIGLLLGMNGFIVFVLEMVLVYILGKRFKIPELILCGLFMVGLGFLVLNLFSQIEVLAVSMFVLSVAEILAMPFMVSFVVDRSGINNRGSYMGLYSLSYAIGHIISPLMGTLIIDQFGYQILWYFSFIVCIILGIAFYFVTKG